MIRILVALAIVGTISVTGSSTPEPRPAEYMSTCVEPDGACLTWDDIRDTEWQTGQGH